MIYVQTLFYKYYKILTLILLEHPLQLQYIELNYLLKKENKNKTFN